MITINEAINKIRKDYEEIKIGPMGMPADKPQHEIENERTAEKYGVQKGIKEGLEMALKILEGAKLNIDLDEFIKTKAKEYLHGIVEQEVNRNNC